MPIISRVLKIVQKGVRYIGANFVVSNMLFSLI